MNTDIIFVSSSSPVMTKLLSKHSFQKTLIPSYSDDSVSLWTIGVSAISSAKRFLGARVGFEAIELNETIFFAADPNTD